MKEITVILCCTWKFAITFPVAVFTMKFSFWKTIILTNIGGFIGLIVSVYLSKLILYIWQKFVVRTLRKRKRKKPVFTRRNRFLVIIKSKYGMPGIVILSPLLLSIPIGAFLTTKYYGARADKIFWLLAGQIVWSFVYTAFYMYCQALM